MKHEITIEGGEHFAMLAEEDTLLRGALRAGVGFPHECGVGGCGACRYDLLEGDVETLWEDAPGLSERDRKRGKRLACQSRPRGKCTIKVRCADEYLPAVPPVRQPVVVVGKRALTADMTEFTLQGERPADFRSGQYALLYPPGTPGARAYSMANQPNSEGLWRFIIRRVANGKGSNALFDQVAVGDAIWLDGPYGHAFLRPDSGREIVCIAGGSGLAPMLSVAQGALALPSPPKIHFFDGVRTKADLCGEALLADAPSNLLRYVPVLSSSPPEAAWNGEEGFVHHAVARLLEQPLGNYEFYFAGPPPMIEALQTLLMVENRVQFGQIHFDRFI